MRAAIVVFPGTNRERDMAIALRRAAGRAPRMVWHAETELDDADLVVLPGGFSHGDYLRSGAMAARSPVMDAVRRHAERGGHVLGVCNGFQVLTEAGLLPGALLRNRDLRFIARDGHLRVDNSDTPFTRHWRRGEVFRAPMAHGDGNYHADDATLDRLEGDNRVVFRYAAPEGLDDDAANPNGSARRIAGICDPSGRVLGLMPHPENAVDELTGGVGGAPLFAAIVESIAA